MIKIVTDSMICNQCPRKCGIGLFKNADHHDLKSRNYCGKPRNLNKSIPLAKTMQHFWEEPCISGVSGSGAVFFSGCNLGCAFCQNYEISNPINPKGITVDLENLEIELFRLKDIGCHNINFVTGTHILDQLLLVMKSAIIHKLDLPIIWNSSAYETMKQIKSLEQCVDIYLPDLKFHSSDLSQKVANAPDYFEVASTAILEMVKQKPVNNYISICKTTECNDVTIEKTVIMKEGVIIRHLVLPGFYKDSIKILEWIEANLSNNVTLSLLSQYIPDFYEFGCKSRGYENIQSLNRKITTFEYEKVVNKAISLGFKDVFTQKPESAKKEYVPVF